MISSAANSSEELTIASTVIRDGGGFRLASSNNGYIWLTNCIINNSSYLSVTYRTTTPEVPVSPIFSLQMDPPPDPVALVKNPIRMTFDVVRC